MKKSQLSRKKSSITNDIHKSQTKISSFFTKVPRLDISNNKIISDVKSLSQTSVDKKRKQRDKTFEELHMSVKKICTDNNISIAESINIKSDEDVVSSIIKDAEDIYSNFKEDKTLIDNAQFQKCNKEIMSTASTKMEYSTIVLQNHTRNINVLEKMYCNNDYILKESQDLNNITLKSSLSSMKTYNYNKTKLNNSKNIEFVKDLSMVNRDKFDDFFSQEWYTNAQIDFSILQKCKITDVKQEPRTITLVVQHVESEAVDIVACSGFWRNARVKVDDIITIQAKRESEQWIVDNNDGFLITQPDTLISGTVITSGVFCNRRAVLSEKFRKIESLPNLNTDYSIMTVGSLIHQWLQKVLRNNVHTLSDIIKLLDNILQSKDTMDYLYTCELSLADCRKRMMEYAPRIFEFMQHYIKDNKQQHITGLKNNFQGSICEIQDIEENVYIPKLGLKGRIDVTAVVNINSRKKIMPLEVKTGRASYSLEHKGQVILYLMMMGFRDQDIDTGLLLYLKENAMQEIRGSHHEKRDLILLRNTLAYYFTKHPENLQSTISELGLTVMELPEPINHHNACTRCPYQTLCCAYLMKDPNVALTPSHPLTALTKKLLSDFESRHLDYIMKWIMLLQLEESYESNNYNMSNMWMMSPEKREAKGTCISNLKVIQKIVEQDDRYQHTFARIGIKGETIENSALGSMFTENDYIIVSTNARINIAAGYIKHISDDVVTILLDRDIIRGEDAHCTFHIDKHPFIGSLFSFSYANVAGLLSNDETIMKLRRIIIDKKPATFVEKLPRSIVSTSARIIKDLNEDQQRAVLRAVAANDYILIKGMPGTGKTQTLVTLIKLLLELNFTVLITAHTHSAVDNILLKLLNQNIDFLRLGVTRQIHSLLMYKTEEYAMKSCDTLEDLETFYNSKRVVGVTCYGAYHSLLRRRIFDVCVVDESTQIMQPTMLRPLYSVRKFILVGDPDQLPPVVRSRTAIKLGADESLFARLDNDNNTINLTKQYRMNRRIMKLANDTTYCNKLVSGSKQVENAILTGSNLEIFLSCERWIKKALSKHLDDSVVLLNTGSTYELNIVELCKDRITSDQIYSNVWEAAIVLHLVRLLVKAGTCARNIGIIAPYNAHVTLLRKILKDKEVEVNTVDQYQGRDKDVILYSCARSVKCNTKKEYEILNDQRRLTVAITRAKHKLIIIADKITLTKYMPFKNLFDVIDKNNVIDLHDDNEEFSWKTLIRSVL